MTRSKQEMLNEIETLVSEELMTNLKNNLQFLDAVNSTSLQTHKLLPAPLSFDQLFGSSQIDTFRNTSKSIDGL